MQLATPSLPIASERRCFIGRRPVSGEGVVFLWRALFSRSLSLADEASLAPITTKVKRSIKEKEKNETVGTFSERFV